MQSDNDVKAAEAALDAEVQRYREAEGEIEAASARIRATDPTDALAFEAGALEGQKAESTAAEERLRAHTEEVEALARRFDAELGDALRTHEGLWLSARRLALSLGKSEPRLTHWLEPAAHARPGAARLYRYEGVARALDALDSVARDRPEMERRAKAASALAQRISNGEDAPWGTTDGASSRLGSVPPGEHRSDARGA